MDTKTIRTAAEQELHKLGEEKEKLERRMKALLQIIEGCNAAEKADTPETASEFEGPTESHTNAVRHFLQRATQAVTPPEIRDALQGAGYSTASSPKHLLITVHGILDRLECGGEVRRVGNAYLWIPEMQRMINRRLAEGALGALLEKWKK